MSVLNKIKVYGLPDAIRGSKYPMSVDVDSVTCEITNNTKKLGSAKIGSGHDNFLNGIIVQFDLTFTVKAWTEAERYHFFEFISSQSTMHCLQKFHIEDQYIEYVDPRMVSIMRELVDSYNTETDQDLKRKKRLKMLYSNPCGFKLTAKMTTNYRQLKTIVEQRSEHLLPEWRMFCDEIMALPHFKELCIPESQNTKTYN